MAQLEWARIFQGKAKDLKDSWSLDFDESLTLDSHKPGWKKAIVTTSGRFRCSDCGRGWSSNNVRVVCHMRLAFRQGVAKVRPFRQNCKVCSEGPMEKPSIESGNISTLLDNLVEKIRIKCYDEYLGNKKKSFRSYDGKSPHEPAHCEACMQGACPKNKSFY